MFGTETRNCRRQREIGAGRAWWVWKWRRMVLAVAKHSVEGLLTHDLGDDKLILNTAKYSIGGVGIVT